MSSTGLSTPARDVILFGASGQLGGAIRAELELRGQSRITCVPWTDVSVPAAHHTFDDLVHRIPALDEEGPVDFVFACGITNPKLPPESIQYSNFEFPKRVIEASWRRKDARYLTFGTVLEGVAETNTTNAYVRSKIALGQWMIGKAREPGARSRILHLRFHTLYGGPPKPYMFLGQIAAALAKGEPFHMSSGQQLREYHHVEDASVSVAHLLRREWDAVWNENACIELSSGGPVKLADLASAVFTALGDASKLHIGKLEREAYEARTRTHARSPGWLMPISREPLQGVIEDLRKYLKIYAQSAHVRSE